MPHLDLTNRAPSRRDLGAASADAPAAACWLALPQGILRLLADETMKSVVTRIIGLGSGIKRLDEDFVKVGCGVRVPIARVPIVRDAAGGCTSSCSC
jgi:hypothetical protein